MKSSTNFDTQLKLAGNSFSIGGFALTKDSFIFNYFSSSLNDMYENTFRVGSLTPWSAKASVDSSIYDENVKVTITTGVEYVARPDRIALIPVLVGIAVSVGGCFQLGRCDFRPLVGANR